MLFADIKSLSVQAFVAPYKLIGLTALSVEREITLSTRLFYACSNYIITSINVRANEFHWIVFGYTNVF